MNIFGPKSHYYGLGKISIPNFVLYIIYNSVRALGIFLKPFLGQFYLAELNSVMTLELSFTCIKSKFIKERHIIYGFDYETF